MLRPVYSRSRDGRAMEVLKRDHKQTQFLGLSNDYKLFRVSSFPPHDHRATDYKPALISIISWEGSTNNFLIEMPFTKEKTTYSPRPFKNKASITKVICVINHGISTLQFYTLLQNGTFVVANLEFIRASWPIQEAIEAKACNFKEELQILSCTWYTDYNPSLVPRLSEL